MTNTTPPLGNVITNAIARKAIYGTYVIASITATAIQVYDAATHVAQPDWLTGALAVIVFLGIPVGGLAIANAPKSTD